jgi:hypothetical protein
MLALLVYVAYPGFACVPSADVGSSPYTGPFVMSVERAQEIKDANTTQIWLEIVSSDDPRFSDIKLRCPPIYF